VEEGGGTNFPQLNNLTITPKKGRALLWPNVRDDDDDDDDARRPLVSSQDYRTVHQALAVVSSGTKYAANAWIHTYDYVSAQRAGCIAKRKTATTMKKTNVSSFLSSYRLM
jgi:prolyl 4-hydroxylase